MFGKLTLDAVPYHEPIIMVTIAAIAVGGLAVVGLLSYFGKWKWLWNEWLTSVDHKRLGIMYVLRGGDDLDGPAVRIGDRAVRDAEPFIFLGSGRPAPAVTGDVCLSNCCARCRQSECVSVTWMDEPCI